MMIFRLQNAQFAPADGASQRITLRFFIALLRFVRFFTLFCAFFTATNPQV
jgi:hypothetical protein